jgi:hypothetical protein
MKTTNERVRSMMNDRLQQTWQLIPMRKKGEGSKGMDGVMK